MKVLTINGSPHVSGCTTNTLDVIERVLKDEGVEVVRVNVPASIGSCLACDYCFEHEGCVRKDLVNKTYALLDECDGMIISSPVYYAGPSGSLMAFLDRLFYSNRGDLNMKAAAVVSNSRRAGNMTTNEVIEKFFSISGMTIINSTYWNDMHGSTVEQQMEDKEGLQTMRNLARNMAYYLKLRELGKKNNVPEPKLEKEVYTNFIR